MDRSFLSDATVVEASRKFVCVRLATYEDAGEAKYLEKLYGSTLANTVFAVLKPDGKSTLTRPSRGPRASGRQMSAWMNELITKDYPNAGHHLGKDRTLPEMKTLELALNVATCDYLQVVVAIGKDDAELAKLRKSLLPLAWDEKLAGQYIFASAKSDADLRSLDGLSESKSGIYVVEPDTYGLLGNVIHRVQDVSKEMDELTKIAAEYKPAPKQHRAHAQLGVTMGLRWETEVPVTDVQSLRATKRMWGEE